MKDALGLAQHEKCWNERDIVDRIADCLIEDHIDLMRQNKMLREVVAELLDEHYPASCYTAETIEYEMEQGNMAMPMVKRAYAALLEKNK